MEENGSQSMFKGVRTAEEKTPLGLGQWRNTLGQRRKLLGQWRKRNSLNPLKPKGHRGFEKAPHSLPEYNLNKSPLGANTFWPVNNFWNGFKFALRANDSKTLRFLNCDWLRQPSILKKALRAGEGRKRKSGSLASAESSFPTSPLTAGGGRIFWRKLR